MTTEKVRADQLRPGDVIRWGERDRVTVTAVTPGADFAQVHGRIGNGQTVHLWYFEPEHVFEVER